MKYTCDIKALHREEVAYQVSMSTHSWVQDFSEKQSILCKLVTMITNVHYKLDPSLTTSSTELSIKIKLARYGMLHCIYHVWACNKPDFYTHVVWQSMGIKATVLHGSIYSTYATQVVPALQEAYVGPRTTTMSSWSCCWESGVQWAHSLLGMHAVKL